jgi:hypothetical protein
MAIERGLHFKLRLVLRLETTYVGLKNILLFNLLTLNDLKRRRAVNLLKIKIPSRRFRQAAVRKGI